MPDDGTDPAIVTPRMIYVEARKTGKQVAVMDTRLGRVETKVDDLCPMVAQACEKANGATVGLAGIKGQWKVLLYFLCAGLLGGLGFLLKGWLQ